MTTSVTTTTQMPHPLMWLPFRVPVVASYAVTAAALLSVCLACSAVAIVCWGRRRRRKPVPPPPLAAPASETIGATRELASLEPTRVLKMYHGTSMAKAVCIKAQGFQRSVRGQLGSGVYLVDEDNLTKALRFAHDDIHRPAVTNLHQPGGPTAEIPALVGCELRVKPSRVFVTNKPSQSWHECFDACRVSATSMSTSSEWCVKNEAQISAIEVHDLRGCPCPYSPHPCPYTAANDKVPRSPWGGRCPFQESSPEITV